MRLIQILLPLYDKTGRRIPRARFQETAEEFARLYGGVTAYTRAPAEGLWRPRRQRRFERDEIVVFEVMSPKFDIRSWRTKRRELERLFDQDAIVIRAISFARC